MDRIIPSGRGMALLYLVALLGAGILLGFQIATTLEVDRHASEIKRRAAEVNPQAPSRPTLHQRLDAIEERLQAIEQRLSH
jgi:hypothetical protein